jgi:hypothetical protein
LERGFTLCCSVLSLLVAGKQIGSFFWNTWGYIIGSIVNLISAVNANTEEFRNKISNINLYMKNKRLPEILNRKVRNYYNHLWSRQVADS